MKTLFVLILSFFLSPLTFAQWSIQSVSATKMEKQTSKVSIDFWLHITIKNDSDDSLYIWGQRGFHIVESFIKDSKSQVWERRNISICGTMGAPSWQEVKAGQEIKVIRREAVGDVGKEMMLTFQSAVSPDGMRRNSEVLLGAFKIPGPVSDEKSDGDPEKPVSPPKLKTRD